MFLLSDGLGVLVWRMRSSAYLALKDIDIT